MQSRLLSRNRKTQHKPSVHSLILPIPELLSVLLQGFFDHLIIFLNNNKIEKDLYYVLRNYFNNFDFMTSLFTYKQDRFVENFALNMRQCFENLLR